MRMRKTPPSTWPVPSGPLGWPKLTQNDRGESSGCHGGAMGGVMGIVMGVGRGGHRVTLTPGALLGRGQREAPHPRPAPQSRNTGLALFQEGGRGFLGIRVL